MEKRFLKMHNIKTRDDTNNDDLYIEGYFARYDDIYEVGLNATESIRKGAFKESKTGDVRALYNHNDDLILGRTTNGTLELIEDENGLYGRVKINRNDTDAMNAYQRIARGDVTGCSFGFEIKSEERTITDDGHVHYELTEISPLYEVSPCVFPAYQATNIEARKQDLERIRKERNDDWKMRMKERLKGENQNGIKSINDKKEN